MCIVIQNSMKLRIKERIKTKGFSMQEFADKMGITRDTLTRTINGNPTIDTLNRYAEALEVPITDFFVQESNTITCPNCGAKYKLEK